MVSMWNMKERVRILVPAPRLHFFYVLNSIFFKITSFYYSKNYVKVHPILLVSPVLFFLEKAVDSAGLKIIGTIAVIRSTYHCRQHTLREKCKNSRLVFIFLNIGLFYENKDCKVLIIWTDIRLKTI